MPEEQRIYVQWRNANESVKYPFAASATLTNGIVTIAPETFIDARLYPALGTESLHLSSIVKTDTNLLLTVSDTTSGELASADVLISDIQTYNLELLELRDIYDRPAGVLVTDPARLGLLTALPIGTHVFEVDATEFTASVVTPAPQTGLRSLVVDGEAAYNEVWLVGGLGVVLEHSIGALHGDDIVTINVVGEPLSKRTICQDEYVGFETPEFLKGLVVSGAFVPPDDVGDFKVSVCGMDVDDTILRVLPGSNGISFAAVGGRIS